MWKNYKRDFLYLTLRQEEVNGMSWSIADSVCKAELLYTAKQSVKLTSPGGGGGTPLYKLYRYVPPHRVWCMCPFGLKTGIHFAQFGLESGMVVEGTTGVYECMNVFIVSIPNK